MISEVTMTIITIISRHYKQDGKLRLIFFTLLYSCVISFMKIKCMWDKQLLEFNLKRHYWVNKLWKCIKWFNSEMFFFVVEI